MFSKGQQKEVAPARTPGASVRLGIPSNPDFPARRAVAVAGRFAIGTGIGIGIGIALVDVPVPAATRAAAAAAAVVVVAGSPVRQEAGSPAGRPGTLSKDRVVECHDVPDGFQSPGADHEPRVEQQIEGFGSGLDGVGGKDPVQGIVVFLGVFLLLLLVVVLVVVSVCFAAISMLLL